MRQRIRQPDFARCINTTASAARTERCCNIIRRLTETELELLTEMICDDLTQSEIARTNGVSRQAVNEKVRKKGRKAYGQHTDKHA